MAALALSGVPMTDAAAVASEEEDRPSSTPPILLLFIIALVGSTEVKGFRGSRQENLTMM
jgi:hypothetical protein